MLGTEYVLNWYNVVQAINFVYTSCPTYKGTVVHKPLYLYEKCFHLTNSGLRSVGRN